jgi:glucose uptake protein
VAIVCNSIASKKHQQGKLSKEDARKGTILAVVAGFLMSTFYPIVALVMDVNNFVSPEVGKITPYTALFIFSLGTLASNFIFNTYVMKRPFVGTPVSYSEYFKGSFSTHLVGILGGAIWGLGTGLSWVSSGEAGPAISYALGQGSPMIAAIWGVFIWKEFKGAKGNIGLLLGMMFVLFFAGLGCIIASGN